MCLSVIIAVYKRADFLAKVFEGLRRQSVRNFEVIVAEDDQDPSIAQLVKDQASRGDFPLSHVTQEDQGFRKNRILNAALRQSCGEMTVFLDGDCVPHPHLLEQYAKYIAPGRLLFGRRVSLGQRLTQKILEAPNLDPLTLGQILCSDSRRKEHALYLPFLPLRKAQEKPLFGHNWGVLKEQLVAINGFDEDYTRASVGEDTDIGWRLTESGLNLYYLKFKAIVYHLHHPENYNNDDTQFNFQILHQKQARNEIVCRNGLVPFADEDPAIPWAICPSRKESPIG